MGHRKKRLAVFAMKTSDAGSSWVRSGTAVVNDDGSISVLLDELPSDRTLHVSEPVEQDQLH